MNGDKFFRPNQDKKMASACASRPPVNPNVAFYQNKMAAEPNKEKIEDILQDWYRKFMILEKNHNYIQWLFPNQERGLNKHAFPITMEEAKIIRETSELKDRVKRAFLMMLGFFGMRLTSDNKFATNSVDRLRILNTAYNHNFQRITRILKSLKLFGYHALMLPWLTFLADLVYKEKKLHHAKFSFECYWYDTLDEEDHHALRSYVAKLLESEPFTNAATTNQTKEPPASPPTTNNQFGTHKVTPTETNHVPPKSTGNFKIIDFYKNQIPFEPTGEFIKDILNWKGDYNKMENCPYYIHWLFPTRGPGSVQSQVVLTDADAKEIRDTPQLKDRVMKAFEMMLYFYGMKLTRNNGFEIENREKVKKLDQKDKPDMKHITRILSGLKNFGHNDLIIPWMKFLADLIYTHKYIPNAKNSFQCYWMKCLNTYDQGEISLYTIYISRHDTL